MLITASNIITSHRSSPNGTAAIVVKGSRIEAVGAFSRIKRLYPGHDILHIENAVLMPGLVNVHIHLELPALLNSVRAASFANWVLNLIQAKKRLTDRDYISAAKKNIEYLIQTGATTVGEICTQGVSPQLLTQSHLRATIFQEIISMNPDSVFRPPTSIVPYRSSLIQAGISPHTPFTVSETALREINEISRRRKIRLCMHVAESRDEIKLMQRRKSGLEKLYQFAKWNPEWSPESSSPFEYLNQIGLLSSNLLVVHAVQVADRDITLIKKSRVSVAHCPRSNNELGVGRMPLKKFLRAGITVGLGTDSLASSPSLNMWDEMQYALKIHRKDRITAKDIFELATIGGARALGLGNQIGTIEPGKKADIIAVPLPSKNTGDIYSDLLRETNSCIMTMVNGKILHLSPDVR